MVNSNLVHQVLEVSQVPMTSTEIICKCFHKKTKTVREKPCICVCFLNDLPSIAYAPNQSRGSLALNRLRKTLINILTSKSVTFAEI